MNFPHEGYLSCRGSVDCCRAQAPCVSRQLETFRLRGHLQAQKIKRLRAQEGANLMSGTMRYTCALCPRSRKSERLLCASQPWKSCRAAERTARRSCTRASSWHEELPRAKRSCRCSSVSPHDLRHADGSFPPTQRTFVTSRLNASSVCRHSLAHTYLGHRIPDEAIPHHRARRSGEGASVPIAEREEKGRRERQEVEEEERDEEENDEAERQGEKGDGGNSRKDGSARTVFKSDATEGYVH